MPPSVPRKRASEGGDAPIGPVRATKSRKPTLFDTVDSGHQRAPTLEENHAYLEQLRHDASSSSSLSDISSSEFEDVDLSPSSAGPRVDKGDEDVVADDDDVDEDVDWEDAMAPVSMPPAASFREPSTGLELTLAKDRTYSFTNPHGKRKGPSKMERQIRIQTHCTHVQFLLFHNLVRNAWICDQDVQQILLSQLDRSTRKEVERWRNGSGLHRAWTGANESPKGSHVTPRAARDWGADAEKTESGAPDLSRGDPLIRLLKVLATFWKKKFVINSPGLRKQGYRPLPVLEEYLAGFQSQSHDPDEYGERIEDRHDFRQLAGKCQGSRDVGAQLFTALVRGIGLEARMVASLQPIGFGWSQAEEASSKSRRTKGRSARAIEDGMNEDARTTTGPNQRNPRVDFSDGIDDDDKLEGLDDDDIGMFPLPSTGRKTRHQRLSYDRDLPYPIYWTEVLSPITNRYISVDALVLNVVASTSEQLNSFQPRGVKAEKAKQVMAYVVGYSSDGTAKDITVRYLKRQSWPGKTKGVRMPVEKVPVYDRRGKVKKREESDWFKAVMSGYTRDASRRTMADDLEERRELKAFGLAKAARKEGVETVKGYSDSAEFVLERHLRREEALRPGAKHVKLFATGKGEKRWEAKVFLRADVVACKTVESWHKEGRAVREGERPLKWVPARAVTLNRQRELEQAQLDGGEKVKQGLYSEDQTAWIIPAPIDDGIIPRNGYGNIDCFVPSMVPAGAVHLALRGTAKICRRLGISHAEAVTGFEFGARRAIPVLDGVVVAAEAEQVVRDAWQADEAARIQKEASTQQKAALTSWKKFLVGLKILERVRTEYGGDDRDRSTLPDESNPFTHRRGTGAVAAALPAGGHDDEVTAMVPPEAGGDFAGGFLVDEDRADDSARPRSGPPRCP